MSCVLRIAGEKLDADALLSASTLSIDRVWRKGALRTVGGTTQQASGVSILASDADFDEFKKQVAEALQFLQSNAAEILSLATFAGVDHATLDFGVSLSEDTVTKFCYLPPELVRCAADARLGLEVSYYAFSGEPEDEA